MTLILYGKDVRYAMTIPNLWFLPDGKIIDLDVLYPDDLSPHQEFVDDHTYVSQEELYHVFGWAKSTTSIHGVIWQRRLTKKQKEVIAEKLMSWNIKFKYAKLEQERGLITKNDYT